MLHQCERSSRDIIIIVDVRFTLRMVNAPLLFPTLLRTIIFFRLNKKNTHEKKRLEFLREQSRFFYCEKAGVRRPSAAFLGQ